MAIQRILPQGVIGWLVFFVAGGAYASLAINVMLAAEVIENSPAAGNSSISERLVAFPAFYVGADPLTGLLVNSVFWGLTLSKITTILWPKKPNASDKRPADRRLSDK